MKNKSIIVKIDIPAPQTKPNTSIVKTIKEQAVKLHKDKTDKILNYLNQGKYKECGGKPALSLTRG